MKHYSIEVTQTKRGHITVLHNPRCETPRDWCLHRVEAASLTRALRTALTEHQTTAACQARDHETAARWRYR